MDRYTINPRISLLKVTDMPKNEDEAYVMVRDGATISSLNFSAGTVLLIVSGSEVTIEQILGILSERFGHDDEMDKDAKDLIGSFIERKWIYECKE